MSNYQYTNEWFKNLEDAVRFAVKNGFSSLWATKEDEPYFVGEFTLEMEDDMENDPNYYEEWTELMFLDSRADLGEDRHDTYYIILDEILED